MYSGATAVMRPGMLKLYADLHNVTLSEANQQIREALGKGEYRTDYIKATPVQEEKATAELAPIEEIHRTYQRMLSMLTLNRKHQEDLQRRGLKRNRSKHSVTGVSRCLE